MVKDLQKNEAEKEFLLISQTLKIFLVAAQRRSSLGQKDQ